MLIGKSKVNGVFESWALLQSLMCWVDEDDQKTAINEEHLKRLESRICSTMEEAVAAEL